MRLVDHLREELVLLPLNAVGPTEVAQAVAARLAEAGIPVPVEEVEEGLLERERAGSTVLDRGVAIPHAVVPGLTDTLVLLGLPPAPVPYHPDEPPVRIFFVLLTPPRREGDHIRLLARICRLARSEEFLEQLARSPSAAAALELVAEAEARGG